MDSSRLNEHSLGRHVNIDQASSRLGSYLGISNTDVLSIEESSCTTRTTIRLTLYSGRAINKAALIQCTSPGPPTKLAAKGGFEGDPQLVSSQDEGDIPVPGGWMAENEYSPY
jgi:hypothetical protein